MFRYAAGPVKLSFPEGVINQVVPKIAVIVPIYGTASLLRKCLDSVLAQTFEELEVICVDDCSKDESAEIVMQYERRDQRVRLIRHQTNLGLGGARNTGLRNARAPFVTGVDSDDHIEPNLLMQLWEGSNEGAMDITASGFCKVSLDGEKIKSITHPTRIDAKQNIFETTNPSFWAKLWRKSLFFNNGIFFPENTFYEDLATTPRLIYKANTFFSIDGDSYNYVDRADSITRAAGVRHLVDLFKCYAILSDFLQREMIYGRYKDAFNHKISKSLHNFIIEVKNNQEVHQYRQLARLALVFKSGFLDAYNGVSKLEEDEVLRKIKGQKQRVSND